MRPVGTKPTSSLWTLGLEALTAVRHGPIAGPDPATLASGTALTLEIGFRAHPSPRRALLVHQGDLPLSGAVAERRTGWSVGLLDGRVELERGARPASATALSQGAGATGAGVAAAWRSARAGSGWHRLLIFLDAVPQGGFVPTGGELDGRPLRAAEPVAWSDVHGELCRHSGLLVGGLRDRAGGHTNLRFGERQGELLERLVLWSGRASGARADQPGRTAGRVRVALSAHGDRWRYTCRDRSKASRVLWDFEDEVKVGPSVVRRAALVPAKGRVHVLEADGAARQAPVPRPPRRARDVRVFGPGDGGYAAFRIPAVVASADGALLAFAEGRRESISDSCRTKELVLRRSHDGGRSWGALSVAGRASEGVPGTSLMNPSPVVDRVHGSGRVVVVGSVLGASEWQIAAGRGRGRLLAWRSDDGGHNWGAPVDVSAQLALPLGLELAWPGARGWRLQVGTLGHAIQLQRGPHRGRLCFVGHGTFGPASVFDALGFLFWSDDLGESWQVGPALARRPDGSPRGWNEGTLAELVDGSLLLSARQYRQGLPVGCRARVRVRWTVDGRALPGPIGDERSLVDSGVQGSLLALESGRLLFCNPTHPTARLRLGLRRSDDGGRHWTRERLLVAGRVGYSDLVEVGGGAVGVLYESGLDGEVRFVRVAV